MKRQSKKGYDPAVAARRATDASRARPLSQRVEASEANAQGKDTESASGRKEYVMISVWKIEPAPWQPRLVFRDIEELADSIRGDGETEGVGVLEPILVREMPNGRYQLLDGERRWRAGKLIAGERADNDFVLPARVFTVSDRVGQLIGQAANDERDQPKPLERALCYRRLREALQLESPGKTIGARRIAGLGWHKRSQVHDYLAVADRLTPAVLTAAGVVDESGRSDDRLVTSLSLKDLLTAANAVSEDERISILRAKADRARGIKRAATETVAEATPASPAEQLVKFRDEGGMSIRVRPPIRTLDPSTAQSLVTTDVTPAMLALVDQAYGYAGGAGYLGDVRDEHALLVLPREVEQLSATQLESLSRDLATLAQRVKRAIRSRRARAVNTGIAAS